MTVELQAKSTLIFVRGSKTPSGDLVRSVRELQPAGHWKLLDETLECEDVTPPGLVAKALARWLFGRRWVSYRD